MQRLGMLVGVGCFLTACAQLPCKPSAYYAPESGAPYTAEAVCVTTREGYKLAGTLTIPNDLSPRYPAVVLITGSHPQDRDMVGSRKDPVSRYRPFRQIADALSRRGMAVLRLDDRGYGCSQGGDVKQATIPERADDIRAGIAYLRDRGEIDGNRLGLLGISEGANIGPLIAVADPSIAALVLMAGSALPGARILRWQVRHDTALMEGITEEERARILSQRMKDVEKWMADPDATPWRKSFAEYDPLPTARRVLCPALILHGDRDAHVPLQHAQALADAMRGGGNDDVTVRILKDHNHLFLEDADGRFTGKRYWKLLQHTYRLREEVLDIIADWLSSRLAP
jgi:dipeptidyl aminopeptidase/acylaminoacyl peptidase